MKDEKEIEITPNEGEYALQQKPETALKETDKNTALRETEKDTALVECAPNAESEEPQKGKKKKKQP
ncbi:MAG: hypothetical protein K2N74_04955, partial [Clostridiales bacterium]|nr:hypothetical protein [Clostridiales bacterium]